MGRKRMSGSTNVSFLLHSVGNYPAGSEIDASIVYADYYYIEALCKLKTRRADGTCQAGFEGANIHNSR